MKNGGKIMKTNKRRLLAALTATTLALTPCFAAGMMNAMAAATTGTSTLSITDSDTAEHDYNAYQLITGTTEAGKLTNLKWGSAIPEGSRSGFITALNGFLNLEGTNVLASTADVQTVAEKLSTVTDSDKKIELAKLISNYVDKTNEKIDMTNNSGTYSASNLANGWYLILDETGSLKTPANENDIVRSANILKIIGDTTINSKHSLPTLEKKIVDGTNLVDSNSAAIGDVVEYNISLKVPDVRGYDKYYYVVEDTLSNGLTYNDDLSITLSGTTVHKDTDGIGGTDLGDYYVTHDNGEIKVVFENAATFFKNKTVDAPIVITYSATLNGNAIIGDDGNPNTAKLVYSNDPSVEGNGKNEPGKPDEPKKPESGEKSVIGETPEDEVKTYTTAIKVIKHDQAEQILKGAAFTLTSSDFNEVRVVSGYSFEQNDDAKADNTYYKLKDGSYTKTAPTGAYTSDSLYDEDAYNKKFNKVYSTSTGTLIEKAGSGSYAVEAQVDENGVIRFEGLKPGTYTLHESKVPEGYNAADDVIITIAATKEGNNVKVPSQWTGTNAAYVSADKAFELTVVNRQGATLPSTGGVGTKLFYLFGSAFVIGASTFIVTKKRVGTNK